jgi:hypothetical protein
MQFALFVGVALLLVGAAFVWIRGASKSEQVAEDELDEDVLAQVA